MIAFLYANLPVLIRGFAFVCNGFLASKGSDGQENLCRSVSGVGGRFATKSACFPCQDCVRLGIKKRQFNHGWTRINTDAELTRISLIAANGKNRI